MDIKVLRKVHDSIRHSGKKLSIKSDGAIVIKHQMLQLIFTSTGDVDP
jgi:hypothetical protein